jgi:DNA-binding response OmpR family regulator
VKILIVEDNKTLNEAYSFILKKEGHNVVTAFNGKEGLDTLKRFKPDIILLDLLMPVMDGLTFLRKYNASTKNKVDVIILSNLDEDQHLKEARKLGATEYILKAKASPSELVTRINQVAKELV